MLLQRALGLPAVTYLHLPLAVAADGTKLSKSGDAPAFAEDAPGRMLWRALAWLGQRPPDELNAATAAEVLSWGVAHWQPRGFAGVVSRPAAIAGISSRLQDTQR
jgi:glutamyl-Q tRNA(Asp) synthetase